MEKRLTVGELQKKLSKVDPNIKITFGSSYYRKCPLVFYRFKIRGEKLLQIELNEIDQGWEPTSEQWSRQTVGYMLEHLNHYDDDTVIDFGSSLDASKLVFDSISTVILINLVQPDKP